MGDHVVMGWRVRGVPAWNCRRGQTKPHREQMGTGSGGRRACEFPWSEAKPARRVPPRRRRHRPISGHFFTGQSSIATYSILHRDLARQGRQECSAELLGPLCPAVSAREPVPSSTHSEAARPARPSWSSAPGPVGTAAIMAAQHSPRRSSPWTCTTPPGARDEKYGATTVVNGRDAERTTSRSSPHAADVSSYAIECTGAIKVVEQAVSSIGMLGNGHPRRRRAGRRIVQPSPSAWPVGQAPHPGRWAAARRAPSSSPPHRAARQRRFPFDELTRFERPRGHRDGDRRTALSGEVVKASRAHLLHPERSPARGDPAGARSSAASPGAVRRESLR